jgi:hypothetical protein
MWKIFDWISHPHGYHMCWLKDLPDCHNSAVAQDIAELCAKEGHLAASIFCNGASGGLNSLNFFPTVASQFTISIPPLELPILQAIRDDPSILQRPVHKQLQKLIVEPLLTLRGSLPSQMVVVIDSLDACEELVDAVISMTETLWNHQLPLQIFATSQFELYQRVNWSHPQFRRMTCLLDVDYLECWKSWIMPSSNLGKVPIHNKANVYQVNCSSWELHALD